MILEITVNLYVACINNHSRINGIISNLKNSSSSGIDNIPTKLIKLCSSMLAPILAHITNQSLMDGIFPESLKIASVVPIFKNGNIGSVSNYRLVSILSGFSKIFEKVFTRSHQAAENAINICLILQFFMEVNLDFGRNCHDLYGFSRTVG